MNVVETTSDRRNAGYISSSVDAPSGHPRKGRNAGYRSHAVGASQDHPREGLHAGYRSSGSGDPTTIFEVVKAPVQRFRSREKTPKQPWWSKVDKVSMPTFLTLAVVNSIVAPSTIPAAVFLGYDFPQNPWLGAAESAGLAGVAVGDFFAAKKFIRSELK